jgi:hypothetical protein
VATGADANAAIKFKREALNMSTADATTYMLFAEPNLGGTAGASEVVEDKQALYAAMAVCAACVMLLIFSIWRFYWQRGVTAKYRPLVTAIYEKHNKEKLGDVEKLLTSYKGQEQKLMQVQLSIHYTLYSYTITPDAGTEGQVRNGRRQEGEVVVVMHPLTHRHCTTDHWPRMAP